jgi:hypothetical protein
MNSHAFSQAGYDARKRAYHFQRGASFVNLQPAAGGKAKSYQVSAQELQKLNLKP